MVPAPAPHELTAFNGKLYFAADDGAAGDELWVSDGTGVGTHILKHIRPGAGASSPTDITVVGTSLYLAANNGAHGNELWVSDGTGVGVGTVLTDLNQLPSSDPVKIISMDDGTVYVVAHEPVNNELALWRVRPDGAGGYTATRVTGTYHLLSWIAGEYFVNVGGTLYFTANQTLPYQSDQDVLWYVQSDPISGSETAVHVQSGPPPSQFDGLVHTSTKISTFSPFHDMLYYLSKPAGSAGNPNLYRMDTQDHVAHWIDNVALVSGSGGLVPTFGDRVRYVVWNAGFSQQMLKQAFFDWNLGTPQDVVQTVKILSRITLLKGGVGNSTYAGTNSMGFNYAVYNSLAVVNDPCGPAPGENFVDIRPNDKTGAVYSVGQGACGWTGSNLRLWRDATEIIASRGNFRGIGGVGRSESAWGQSTAYFLIDDLTTGIASGIGLGVDYTPTPSGFQWIMQPSNGDPAMDMSLDQVVEIAPGRILFAAANAATGMELWFSDMADEMYKTGGGAPQLLQVQDIAAGADSSSPDLVTVSGDQVYLVATTRGNGRELWAAPSSAILSNAYPANNPPVAGPNSYTIGEDAQLDLSTINPAPLSNDTDADGDPLRLIAAGPASANGGSIVKNAFDHYVYTPAANFNGTDTFTYVVGDGKGGQATGTVTVTVNPVNDPPAPTASPDPLFVVGTATVTGQVSPNDPDVGDTHTYFVSFPSGIGSESVNANGVVSYTPNSVFLGNDSFEVTVTDHPSGATGTVWVHVNAVATNTPPSPTAPAIVTDEDTTGTTQITHGDPDVALGDTVTYAVTGLPQHGNVALDANGLATYTPAANYNGGDTFGVTVTDSQGATGTVTINVAVHAVNDPPAPTAPAITTNAGVAGTSQVSPNDPDVGVAGDTHDYSVPLKGSPGGPANGTVTVSTTGLMTYTPDAGFIGSDSFVVTVMDFGTPHLFGTVTINVTVNAMVPYDFDADGKSDILWRNTNGNNAVWLMNGTALVGGGSLPSVPSGWQAVGVGDFGGPASSIGKADILWRDSSGNNVVWLMNGTTPVGSGSLPTIPTSWQVAGTGDFNADGMSDILWHNTNGNNAVWLMNGTALVGGGPLPSVPSGWQAVGVGDFGGPASSIGKADILWRNTSGNTVIWLMNGTTPVGSGSLPTIPTSWQVMP